MASEKLGSILISSGKITQEQLDGAVRVQKSSGHMLGEVLRDQFFYMKRVGFYAFATRSERGIHEALNSLGDFSQCGEIFFGVTIHILQDKP